MSDDLVKRLRGWARDIYEGSTATWAMDQDLKSAADRIEELEERLEAAEKDAKEAEAYAGELEAKLAKAEAMFDREIKRVKKLQSDFPPPHKVSLSSVECEYKLMLSELTGGKDG